MRWSWPFARRPNPPAAGGDSSPAAARHDAGETGAWASLPPIQRTVGDARLTAPAGPFLRAVPGTRQLPQFLQPLGHEANPMAPAGLVLARSRPRAAPAPGPLVASQAVQRQAEARLPDTTRPSGQQPAPPPLAQRPPHEEAAAPTKPQMPGPARQLSVVPAATVAIPSVSLIRWDAGPASSRSNRPAADTTGPAAGPGGMRRARSEDGGGAPVVSRRPSGTDDAFRSASPGEVALPPRLPGSAGLDSAAPVRRAGLGAPLPPAAPAGRLVAPAARPAAVQRSVGGPVVAAAADSPIHSRGPSRGDEGPPDRRLPILAVARTAGRSASGPDSVTAGQRPARPASSPERPAPPVPAAPEVRATLGRRPLRPIARVQRAASDEPSASEEGASGSPPGQSWPSVTEGATFAAPQWGGGPGIPSALAPPQPGWRSDTAAIGEGSGPPPGQWRAPQAHAARPSTPAGHPTVQRMSHSKHPLVRTSGPAAEASFPATAAEQQGPRPSVQTSASPPAGTGAPVLVPTATPVVQRLDGAAPVADDVPDRRSDRDLDELARALFGRIRGQLRSELIHDREAKGLIFDNL